MRVGESQILAKKRLVLCPRRRTLAWPFTKYKDIFISSVQAPFFRARERVNRTPLRDTDIRAPLHDWLNQQHADCPDTGIIHELRIPRPSARIDMAVVNGELCGFEIKSDVDSLGRLPRQAVAFNAVFERVCVVTTHRHSEAACTIVPDWWAIIVPAVDDGLTFATVREGDRNPRTNPEAMLHMLYCREVLTILDDFDLACGLREERRNALLGAALNNLEPDQIRQGVRDSLKARARLGSATRPLHRRNR